MHKVLNYGSVLQAYALQTFLENRGCKVEIIDYVYPNYYHKSLQKVPLIKKILVYIWQLLWGRPGREKNKKIIEFCEKMYNTSPSTYFSQEALAANPPLYDIYLTGSDQVWNPKYIASDTSFMLSFVKGVVKIAYSASFATNKIPIEFHDLYATCLKEYKAISVREKKGCEIIKDLTGLDATNVLDPTLLLSKEDWEVLASSSSLQITEPYILVYVLGYSFNPYPYIIDFIKFAQKLTGYTIVLLNISNIKSLSLNNVIRNQSASPQDFVKLFSNASLVITDSFHGTAFSLNMERPFYSIVSAHSVKDSRVSNLLYMVGADKRVVRCGVDFPTDFKMEYSIISRKLQLLRNESAIFLSGAL